MATSTNLEGDGVTYWEGWHRHAKEPIGPLTIEQASHLELNRRPYVVLLGNPLHPRCFIEVNDDFYGISFLDEGKRERLSYTFEELEPGRLFLSEAIHREFNESSDSILLANVYRFSPEGRASMERNEPPFNRASVSDFEAEISKNWEPKPVFGDYASIAREER